MKQTRISATTIKLALLAIFTSLVLTASAQAATYTVTKTADTNDGVCDTDCSLREAIAVANGTVANDIIEFDATAFGTAQTITLSGTTLTLANNGTLTINGTGANLLTISGNNASRVFTINASTIAAINNLTITNGGGVSVGGGILNSGGNLTLNNLRVINNSVTSAGGGVASNVNNGTLTINNSTISGNTVVNTGGGIYVRGSGSTLMLSNSTVSGNTGAAFGGGGIRVEAAATVTVNNSTISGNAAGNSGGGGISAVDTGTTATLNSTTLSNNSATNNGGGVGVFVSGTLTLNNTIIADSTSGGDCVGTGSTINANYSLIEANLTCVNGTNSNNLTGDPNLGPLQNNGGATFTHALLAGSIATDKGNSALTQDQRGSLRPVNDPNASNGTGNLADIGAFEVQAPGGDLDLPFASNISGGGVTALAVQADGKIVIGGLFTSVGGVARNRIARLNSDGTLDTTFLNGLSGTNDVVNAVAVQADGKIVLVGNFSTVNGTARLRIARLNSDGTLDTAFLNGLSGVNFRVNAVVVQPDNKIILGGGFTTINGVVRSRIGRLNTDGTVDTAFLNGPSGVSGGDVNALALQADGKIVLGGSGFGQVNGVARNNLARLNSDGTLDTGFLNGLTGADISVSAVGVQADGKVVIGGGFTTINGVARNRIAQLNSNGTVDTNFLNGLTGADSSVSASVVQADGKIIIGGFFTTINGVSRNRIARLNNDGTLDTGFLNGQSGADSSVFALALQTDGKVLLGGTFGSINGTARPGLARLLAFPAAMSGTLQFSTTGYSVNENAGTALITVTRTGGSEGAVMVNYATSDGTAIAGNDYTSASGTLTFLEGETSKTFTVPITDDPTQEGLETVNLTLSAPMGGATLGTPSSVVLTIVDNDGFSIAGRIADGSNVALVDIPVAISGAVTRVVRTDTNGNYAFTNLPAGGTYTVSPNSPYHIFTPARADFANLTANQTQNFTGTLSDMATTPLPPMDNFGGPNRDPERWNLGTLTQPPGALDPSVTVAQTNGQLVITPRANVDSLHYNGYVSVDSFDLSNGQISVELPLAGTNGAESIFAIGVGSDTFLRFVVISPRPNQLLRVQPVVDGVKQAPVEANMPMLMFQFIQNGQVFLNAVINYDPVAHRFLRFRHSIANATNDIVFETSPDATGWPERARASLGERSVSGLSVELSGGTSGSAGNPGPVIFDNLVTQVVNARFATAAVTVNEADGQVTLTVTRSGLTNLTGSVEYSTADGTASQRSRYVASAGVLNFASGETSKTLQILLVDDALVQGTQNFNVFLGPGVGMGVNGPGRVAVTINDNDTPPITSNPVETPAYFVSRQYYDFLSRTPDGPGLDYWAGQITSCGNDQNCISARRWQVSLAFFVELEFQQTGAYVYRLYRAAYGNNQPFPNPMGDNLGQVYCVQTGCPFRAAHIPSYQKFVTDRARVVGSQNLAADQLALATTFANRAEFRAVYPLTQTAAQYVDALLARIQTDSEANLTSQRTALIGLYNAASNQAAGRGVVLYRLADDNAQSSPINNRAFIDAEYNRGFVLTQYFGYLRRDPDMPGLNFWRDTVERFPLRNVTGQNAMVCAFVTSQEYQERFSLVSPRSNSECPPAP